MIDDDDVSLSPVRHVFNDCIDDMDAKKLCPALKDVASPSRKTTGCSAGWTSSGDDANAVAHEEEVQKGYEDTNTFHYSTIQILSLPDSETDQSGRNFKEQRKSHYDEFFKIKELRQKGSFLEDEHDRVEDDLSSSLSSGVKDIGVEEGTATLP
ncbi:hypothetical protein E1A91_A09G192100v1 [Gossypium mustelinum]|nr:hypothetical protein E1A91_A09G192100v1 [Gossypium mustelinum]TYJ19453.1 hypothetical protein E1A91_A09G192100v1 [Gossypium mustelinum]